MDNPNVFLTAKGLVTQPNELSAEPGSMKIANNVIIKRDNIVEQRRGFQLYGTSLGSVSDTASQFIEYRDRILRHYSDVLQWDTEQENTLNESIFNTFSGSYENVSPGLRIKSIQSNGNLYFTTEDGIKKISAKTASQFSSSPGYIVNAGAIKATNINAILKFVLGEAGFLPTDSAVAYRVVWGSTDANNNLILGTPSNRTVVYNSMQQGTIKDFNNLLSILDNIQYDTGSLIDDGNYLTSLGLSINASAEELYTNLISLCEKLDLNPGDILSNAQVASASISNGICTVSISNNIGIYGRMSKGDSVYLDGFTISAGGSGSVNGVQTVLSVNGDSTNNFSFLSSASGTVSTLGGDVTQGWFRSIKQPNIPSSPATHTELLGLSNYLENIMFELRSEHNINTIAKNDATSTIFPQEINLVSRIAPGSMSVSFITGDTVDSLVAAQYVELSGTWNFTGTASPILVYPVASVGTTNCLLTIEATSTNPITIGPSSIISKINRFSTDTVNNWFLDLEITSSSNVLLYIDIPPNASVNTFYQIYRSNITEAELTDNIFDLIPDDDMRQVYEAFPTQQEIDNGEIVVEDIVTEAFFQGGAFLYTNENGGDGILQANDIPPLSYDINRFRNVIFYANTRIKHNMQGSLLGVANIIQDYDNGLNPAISISSEESLFEYKFIKGVNQKITITAVAGSSLVNGDYFTLNTPDDVAYSFFFFPSGSEATNPTTDSNAIGIPFNSGMSVSVIAALVAEKINVISESFVALSSGNTVSVINVRPGPSDFVSGPLTIVITTAGAGESAKKQITNITTISGGQFSSLGSGDYFTLSTPFDKQNFYFWYDVGNGNTEPVLSGNLIAMRIAIDVSNSPFIVAQKTANAINLVGYWTAVAEMTNKVIITDINVGPSTPAVSHVPNGFYVISVVDGKLNVLLSNNISPSLAVEETILSLVNIVNKNEADIVSAFYLSGVNDTPGKFLLESKTVVDVPFYLFGNTNNVGNSFNPTIDPDGAITSIVANGSLTTITANGHRLANDDSVIMMDTNSYPTVDGIYVVVNTTTNTFQIVRPINLNGSAGSFKRLEDAEISDNDRRPNRLYYSKVSQPEAVPILNYVDIGAEEKAILRIFPLRNSLFIFKEDGLYRLSGTSEPWDVQLFDSTCIINAADSIGVVNNFLCVWTTKGISSISEVGVEILSRAIDIDILRLANNNFTNFPTATWGVGYESDNSYLAYTVTEETDVVATQAYRYDTLTNSWTKYDKGNTCGIVKSTDDKLYMGAGDINYLEQERKDFSRTDYADRQYEYGLQDNNYNSLLKTMKLSEVFNIFDFNPGDVLTQDQDVSIYDFLVLNEKLDFDPIVGTKYNIATSVSSVVYDNVTGFATIQLLENASNYIAIGDNVVTSGLNPFGYNGVKVVESISSTHVVLSGFSSNPGAYLQSGGKLQYSFAKSLTPEIGNDLRDAIVSITAKLALNPFIELRKQYSLNIEQYSHQGVSVSALNPGLVSLPNYNFAPSNVNVAGNTISISATVLANSDRVTLVSTGTLPGGLSSDGVYYIVNTSGSSFKLSLSDGGGPIDITSQGSGVHTIRISHNLRTGRYISVTNSTTTPNINGNYFVTEINAYQFSIPVLIQINGLMDYETLINNFEDIKGCYNITINNLNIDTLVAFSNYVIVTTNTFLEAIITDIDKVTRTFTLDKALQFVVGPVVLFEAITSVFEYLPVSLQTPAMMNQFRETQVMYIDKTFTNASLGFSSDLKPEFIPVPVLGLGSGLFGNEDNGEGYYGGIANSTPFRTYVPRDCARSRYLRLSYTHSIAREKYGILGISVTGRPVSVRAYR